MHNFFVPIAIVGFCFLIALCVAFCIRRAQMQRAAANEDAAQNASSPPMGSAASHMHGTHTSANGSPYNPPPPCYGNGSSPYPPPAEVAPHPYTSGHYYPAAAPAAGPHAPTATSGPVYGYPVATVPPPQYGAPPPPSNAPPSGQPAPPAPL